MCVCVFLLLVLFAVFLLLFFFVDQFERIREEWTDRWTVSPGGPSCVKPRIAQMACLRLCCRGAAAHGGPLATLKIGMIAR